MDLIELIHRLTLIQKGEAAAQKMEYRYKNGLDGGAKQLMEAAYFQFGAPPRKQILSNWCFRCEQNDKL